MLGARGRRVGGRGLAARTHGSALAAICAVVAALAACGSDDRPELPEGAVAVVGDATISNADLYRASAVLQRIQSKPGNALRRLPIDVPEQARSSRELQDQALTVLLYATAVEQEAAQHGIAVSTAQARRRWRRLAGIQLRTPEARRRYLGGLSVSDMVAQLRIQMLATKVQSKIAIEAGGGREGSLAAARFRKRFRGYWRERTACRADFDVEGCPPS